MRTAILIRIEFYQAPHLLVNKEFPVVASYGCDGLMSNRAAVLINCYCEFQYFQKL